MKLVLKNTGSSSRVQVSISTAIKGKGDASIVSAIDQLFASEVKHVGMLTLKDYAKVLEYRDFCFKLESALDKLGLTSVLAVGSNGVVSTVSNKRDNEIVVPKKLAPKLSTTLEKLGFPISKSDGASRKKKLGALILYAVVFAKEDNVEFSLSIEPSYQFR